MNEKRFDTIFWGSILIWAGLIFGAESLGYLSLFGTVGAWTWVFLGAGVIALGLNLYRILTPDQPNPEAWDWIFTAFFLIGGLSGFGFDLDLAWPIILIIIGVGIIGNAIMKR